jgi:hypothetical protein
MIKFKGSCLSADPNAIVSPDKKYNVAKDGRLYFVAFFSNPSNPFAGEIRRNIFQQLDSQGNAYWKTDRSELVVGRDYEGSIITSNVEPYVINDREVSTYTCVVFAHENLETVLRNNKHTLATAQQTTVAPVNEVVELLEKV